ncbi:MAG TPA: DUF4097 family beta strand repeat-containing protein, partial [Ardenticatenaceae bacterium]|nr:DUF4097 family beta strand repeat-containing protein [Ardenticatenaceae bacterium]
LLVACCVCALAMPFLTGLGLYLNFPGAGPEVTTSEELRLAVSEPAVLTIDNPVGRITVSSGASDEIVVDATLGARSQDILDQIAVSLDPAGDGAALRVGFPERRNTSNTSVDLDVRVPEQTNLTIRNGVGDVRIEGLEGQFDVETGVGTLDVTDVAMTAATRFAVGTGDVEVAGSLDERTTLQITSSVGEIAVELPEETGFELEATTGTGDVELEGFELETQQGREDAIGDQVDTRTTRDPAGRRLILETGVGSISVDQR